MWLLVPVSCSTVQLNWVFHITLYFSVLNLMKYFCIMPLDGLLSTDVRHLKFEWVSIRVFFAFVFLSMGYVETLMEYIHNLNGKFTLGAVGMKCVFKLYLHQFLIHNLESEKEPNIIKRTLRQNFSRSHLNKKKTESR
jgi:hypothetical protein